MEVTLVGSTNGIKTKDEALKFGRAAARICYSAKGFEQLASEEDKIQLTERLVESGHHSVFDHIKFNFYFENLPKIEAMILNNEHAYVTSEKSARYTKMELGGLQKELYDKWFGIFQKKIKGKYGDILDETRIKKLAQENARYLTSVFTPTKMLHTLSFRQVNYIMHFFEQFMSQDPSNNPREDKFYGQVRAFMDEFLNNSIMKELYVPKLESLNQRRLSLFAERTNFEEKFGKNYSVTYKASFACLAQLHRHRTIDYEMWLTWPSNFFTPPILKSDSGLVEDWNKDCMSLEDEWPQGRLVNIHESGSCTDFISKMNERLCGQAQLEIMRVTKAILDKYIQATEKTNPEVHKILLGYSKGPRCTFNQCRGACEFGKDSLERLI